MGQHVNNLGTWYDLPDFLLDKKYHGCGNGQIVIEKESGQIVDMDYLDEADWIIEDQNIAMHPDAGEVISETDQTITYRANFSCCTACLF